MGYFKILEIVIGQNWEFRKTSNSKPAQKIAALTPA